MFPAKNTKILVFPGLHQVSLVLEIPLILSLTAPSLTNHTMFWDLSYLYLVTCKNSFSVSDFVWELAIVAIYRALSTLTASIKSSIIQHSPDIYYRSLSFFPFAVSYHGIKDSLNFINNNLFIFILSFLIVIILDAKHEKNVGNNQDFFAVYIRKFLPTVGWTFWI